MRPYGRAFGASCAYIVFGQHPAHLLAEEADNFADGPIADSEHKHGQQKVKPAQLLIP